MLDKKVLSIVSITDKCCRLVDVNEVHFATFICSVKHFFYRITDGRTFEEECTLKVNGTEDINFIAVLKIFENFLFEFKIGLTLNLLTLLEIICLVILVI